MVVCGKGRDKTTNLEEELVRRHAIWTESVEVLCLEGLILAVTQRIRTRQNLQGSREVVGDDLVDGVHICIPRSENGPFPDEGVVIGVRQSRH